MTRPCLLVFVELVTDLRLSITDCSFEISNILLQCHYISACYLLLCLSQLLLLHYRSLKLAYEILVLFNLLLELLDRLTVPPDLSLCLQELLIPLLKSFDL